MTSKRKPFTYKRGWIDVAALKGNGSPSREVREVDILSEPDEFDHVLVRPLGQSEQNVHRRWLRDNPRKGY